MSILLITLACALTVLSAFLWLKIRKLRSLLQNAEAKQHVQMEIEAKHRAFLRELIHDLNGPLTVVLGRTRQLLDTLEHAAPQTPDTEEATERAYMVEKNALKIDQILKDCRHRPY